MFQHTAVALLLDVLEIVARCATGRVPLAHVAESSGKFGQLFSVGRLTQPRYPQVLRLEELRS